MPRKKKGLIRDSVFKIQKAFIGTILIEDNLIMHGIVKMLISFDSCTLIC